MYRWWWCNGEEKSLAYVHTFFNLLSIKQRIGGDLQREQEEMYKYPNDGYEEKENKSCILTQK